MRYFTYEHHDELFNALRDCKRLDQAIHVPHGGQNLTEAAADFWDDVRARFCRGEWADAVTAIERRFESRMNWPDARQRATLENSRGKRAA